ncbi:MAG: ATP-dependent Clp protease adaptor ClpS [Kiritimatiellae bacterium]|nr:ATP-dependent Clp protease adaptor ClpS [Kiritimatiellia bacterium]MBP5226064.1 ATP-dependent Clp protease adaptor ClpS [Kiritimatiellia bacterium]
MSETVTDYEVKTDMGIGMGWSHQVILFNDDVNTFDYVIKALMSVFGHSSALAERIAMEAHEYGRAVAETEEEPAAVKHAAALRELGLRASAESI